MALEEQSCLRSRQTPSRCLRIGKDVAMKDTTSQVVPLPIPPPPTHRKKSPTRSPLTRRSSTPCRVSAAAATTTTSSKTSLNLRSSTPTSNLLTVDKRNSWTPNNESEICNQANNESNTKDSLCDISNRNNDIETTEKAYRTKFNNTILLFSPTMKSPDKTRNNSHLESRHRQHSPIRLDPPPRKKSKSQSPSRPNTTPSSFQYNSNVTHTPVHVSRSVPAKKQENLNNVKAKSPTRNILNGFVSTPQTPTVTITPTSTPPKNLLDSFPNIEINRAAPSSVEYQLQENQFPANKGSGPSRQSGIGGFQGCDSDEDSTASQWAETVPLISSTKQRGSISKLLDMGESSDVSEKETDEASTATTVEYLGGALQLPDLPDVICSRASSSEDPESPNKTPVTPSERPESRLHLGAPRNFPLVHPADLTDEELRDFAMRWGSPHHAPSSHTMLLTIPPPSGARPRVTSLPAPVIEPPTDMDEKEEYYRLRHFSIIGRGIVNRGDSIKTRRSKSGITPLESHEMSQWVL